jgi:hypothetical protein
MGDDSYTYEYYSSSSSEKAPKKKEKEKEKQKEKVKEKEKQGEKENSIIQMKEKEELRNNNREKEVPAPKPIIKVATTKNPVYAKPLPELKKKNEISKEDSKEDKKESKVQKDVKPKEQLIKPPAPQEDFSKEFANAKKLAEEEAANAKQHLQQADNAIGAGKQDESDYYSDYSDSYYSEYYSEEETEQDRDNKRLLEFAKQIPTMKTDYNNLNFIYRSCIEANGSNEYTPAQLVFLDALIARMNELKGKK